MQTGKILIYACLLLAVTVQAQIRPVSIGEKCPDILITDIYEGAGKQVRLSDLRGKVVILDFWSSNCTSCIEAMPLMDSLQRSFGDSLIILPVVSVRKIDVETSKWINTFWRSNKYTKKTKLPYVVDTVLYKYFPMDGVPFEVWIDRDGILRGMTSAQYVNAREIRRIYKGEAVNWEIYTKLKYDYEKPMLAVRHRVGDSTAAATYSAMLPYQPRLRETHQEHYGDSLPSRLCAVNYSLMNLFLLTMYWDFTPFFDYNRMILEVPDPENYLYNREQPPLYEEEWNQLHARTVEIIAAPYLTKKQMAGYLRQDLNRWLGLNARREKRNVPCLILKYTDKTKRLILDSTMNNEHRKYAMDYVMLNANHRRRDYPIIDETGLKGNINALEEMPFEKPLPIVQQKLKPYGLTLELGYRDLEMLVISR